MADQRQAETRSIIEACGALSEDDHVVNTGYSLRLTMDAIRSCGGEVVAAATWISRGNVGASDLDVDRYVFLDEVSLPSWPAETCPLCEKGMSVNTRFAHGADYLAERTSK